MQWLKTSAELQTVLSKLLPNTDVGVLPINTPTLHGGYEKSLNNLNKLYDNILCVVSKSHWSSECCNDFITQIEKNPFVSKTSWVYDVEYGTVTDSLSDIQLWKANEVNLKIGIENNMDVTFGEDGLHLIKAGLWFSKTLNNMKELINASKIVKFKWLRTVYDLLIRSCVKTVMPKSYFDFLNLDQWEGQADAVDILYTQIPKDDNGYIFYTVNYDSVHLEDGVKFINDAKNMYNTEINITDFINYLNYIIADLTVEYEYINPFTLLRPTQTEFKIKGNDLLIVKSKEDVYSNKMAYINVEWLGVGYDEAYDFNNGVFIIIPPTTVGEMESSLNESARFIA